MEIRRRVPMAEYQALETEVSNLELTSIADAVKIAHTALAAIEAQGVIIPASSPLRADLEAIEHHYQALLEGKTYDEAYDFESLRIGFRRRFGALEVLKRIVALDQSARLSDFSEALQHFRDGGVSLASPFTDYPSLNQEAQSHTRLLYEFYIASSLALNGSLTVEIAGTKDTSQGNPDVLIKDFPIEGIACKVVACKSDVTLLDRLMEGAEQVERSQCSAGIVALDIRQCVDQEILMPKIEEGYRTFRFEHDAIIETDLIIRNVGERIQAAIPDDYRHIYAERTKRAAFLLTAQGFAIIETETEKVPLTINRSHVIELLAESDAQYFDIEPELRLANWIDATPNVTLQS